VVLFHGFLSRESLSRFAEQYYRQFNCDCTASFGDISQAMDNFTEAMYQESVLIKINARSILADFHGFFYSVKYMGGDRYLHLPSQPTATRRMCGYSKANH
jgi:hypothetical protein